ncbi:MAG: DsrE family protein [Planctomycetota bacterium]
MEISASEAAPRRIQIVATSGPADIPRACLALEAALAAAASGLSVRVFLVLDATKWACEPRRAVGDRVYALLDQLEAMGVVIRCCSSCVTEHCGNAWDRLDAVGGALTDGAVAAAVPGSAATIGATMKVSGLAEFVEGVAAGVPTVTF